MTDSGPYTFRRLAEGDVSLLRELLAMFGEAFEEVDTYTKQQPSDTYIAELLGRDQFIALAAVRGNAVIGGLAAYELKKFEQERSEIYLYDLAVAAEHRRSGVATRLIKMLKPIAVARGAHVIFVQADRADKPAVALYTKLGIREDVLHFDIPVA